MINRPFFLSLKHAQDALPTLTALTPENYGHGDNDIINVNVNKEQDNKFFLSTVQ